MSRTGTENTVPTSRIPLRGLEKEIIGTLGEIHTILDRIMGSWPEGEGRDAINPAGAVGEVRDGLDTISWLASQAHKRLIELQDEL